MMKTKQKNLEPKSTESKKGRPRLNDVLIVPRGAFKKLTEVAGQTRMPIQLVYEDALWNGISTLPEMYKSVIAFRATRDGMINEQPNDHLVQKPEANGSQEPKHPAPSGTFDPEFADPGEEQGPDIDGPDNADVERGHLAEDPEVDRALDDAVQFAHLVMEDGEDCHH